MLSFLSFSDVIGLIGDAMTLIAFYLLNTQRINSTYMSYQALNCFGAFCVLYSLMYQWNTPAVTIEIAWVMISLMGIFRILRSRRKFR